MPTTRPRHSVTETDEITAVLNEAERRWPGVSRSELTRLVIIDWAQGGRAPSVRAQARDALIGSLPSSSDLYSQDEDWPA